MAFTPSVALALLSTLISAATAFDPPSSLETFRPVLALSKLQYENGDDPDIEAADLLAGYANWFFYLSGTKMTFKMNGDKRRSELRQMDTGGTTEAAWSVKTFHKLVARIAIPEPHSAMNEITLLQIHCSEDVPALRISFVKSKETDDDGLTHENAIITTLRLGFEKNSDTYTEFLMDTHTDFVWYTLEVNDSFVDIWLGPIHKRIDLSVWEDLETCYFKAGAYINKPDNDLDSGITEFESLTWE